MNIFKHMYILIIALVIGIAAFIYYMMMPMIEFFHREGLGNRLVMYKVDWCPHCRKAKPAFEELMKYFQHREDIELQIVDCEEHQDRCDSAKIKGYPTFMLEKADGSNHQCRSALTRHGIEDFLSRHL